MRLISVAMIGLFGVLAGAASAVGLSQDKDKGPPAPKRLDRPGLEKILKNLGFEIQTYLNVPFIMVYRPEGGFVVRCFTSTANVTFECPLIWLDNEEKYSSEGLLRLLEENRKIGPSCFSLTTRAFVLNRQTPNVDVTAAVCRKEIDKIVDTLVATMPLWKRGRQLLAFAPLPETPESRADLQMLQGVWVPAGGEIAGTTLGPDQLKSTVVKWTVKESKLFWQAGDQENSLDFCLDTIRSTKRMNLYDPKTKDLSRAIYQFKDEEFWLCYDRGVSNYRLTRFTTGSNTDDVLIKMRKTTER